ncbi:hypothetical protein ACFIJ5_14660 [Haloimpatiens sp. FM7330]|uniref:hypothetical protein n=1 Tax=Haloimpatiens sp. FM7330 TaxID=3298610 RepID=UPI003636BF7D
MKIKNSAVAIILLVIIFGGIGTAKYLNVWKTESTKIPQKYKTGEFAGKYDPADIRGSYAFSDINKAFDIDINLLGEAFGVKNDDNLSEFKIKDFENIYSSLADNGTEIGTSSMKLFVALYKGLPYEIDEDTYLPKKAVEILKEKGNLTNEQLKYVEEHSVEIKENTSNDSDIETEEKEEDEEKIIKGKTTFKEVMDFGVSQESIEKIIRGKITNKALTVRDYCEKNNIEFSTIKAELQKEIDDK